MIISSRVMPSKLLLFTQNGGIELNLIDLAIVLTSTEAVSRQLLCWSSSDDYANVGHFVQ